MDSESLPTYQKATNPDKWEIIAEKGASHITPDTLAHLCRVCKHTNKVFTPLLWRDPLKIIFEINSGDTYMDQKDRIDRFVDFQQRIPNWRPSTSAMVQVLDFRYFQGNPKSRTLLKKISIYDKVCFSDFRLYSGLKFVIVDRTDIPPPKEINTHETGANELDHPWQVYKTSYPAHLKPKLVGILFSAAGCPNLFSRAIVKMPFSFSIVYLDLSYSRNITYLARFDRSVLAEGLPHLRILKLRGTDLTDAILASIGKGLGSCLWSLDVRDNHLSNCSIETLALRFRFFIVERDGLSPSEALFMPPYNRSLPPEWMVTPPLFPEVSKLTIEKEYVSGQRLAAANSSLSGALVSYGESESQLSIDYPMNPEDLFLSGDALWDPERYLVVQPLYTQSTIPSEEEQQRARDSGLIEQFRPDTTDGVIKWYSDYPEFLHSSAYAENPDILLKRTHLTHLYISGNKFSSDIVSSPHGPFRDMSHLQLLDIDHFWQPTYTSDNPFYKQDGKTSRLLRSLHNAQGVFYQGVCKTLPFNLEVLKIHHSFITQTNLAKYPNRIDAYQEPLRTREQMKAEDTDKNTRFFGYRPNQNPKLRELTLVDVPRKSLGRVVSTLKFLIHFAADQEWHLKRIASSPEYSSRRSPKLLPGLRLIRLEFRKEGEKEVEKSATGDADADTFIQESMKDFSFFDDDMEKQDQSGVKAIDDMSVLLDVEEELKIFRDKTRRGLIRSPYWGGKLELVS